MNSRQDDSGKMMSDWKCLLLQTRGINNTAITYLPAYLSLLNQVKHEC